MGGPSEAEMAFTTAPHASKRASTSKVPRRELRARRPDLNVVIANDTLTISGFQSQYLAQLATLTEVLTGAERVVGTPLPVAYRH